MGFDYYLDGPIHKSDMVAPHLANEHESLPIQFLRSAVYAGVQEPISGVVQLADKVSGSHFLPHVQFIDPCERADFGSASWHTQQFGAMLGVTAGLLALNKGVGKAGNFLAGPIDNISEHQGALALRSVAEAAATGFIHNGLFRPVGNDEGNFYAARLKNAAVGAGTYATLTASGLGLKYLAQGQDNVIGTVLRSNVGATVISGIPGGFAYAEMKSLADGKGLASSTSIGQAVYSFSVLGGAFAAGKELIGSTHAEDRLNALMKSSFEAERAKAADIAKQNQWFNPRTNK
jgi:hypothetical protein